MPRSQAAPDPTAFPPPPWRLQGALEISAWLVPPGEAEAPLPAGWRPFEILGRRLVGAVLARYDAGGDLAYRELAAGLAIRRGLKLAVTVPWIWVDDPRALAGGRALWAMPKQPARFRRAGDRLEANDAAGRSLAARTRRVTLFLPGRWSVTVAVAQPAATGAVLASARITGRPALIRTLWRTGGPLAFLDGRWPLLSLRLDAAELEFRAAEGFG